jgi:hypothetical protein
MAAYGSGGGAGSWVGGLAGCPCRRDLAAKNECSSSVRAQGFSIRERGKVRGIKRKSLPLDRQEGLLMTDVFRDLIRSNLLRKDLGYQTSE